MTYGHTEFPAASYDAWKLDPGIKYEDDPREECDHTDFTIDWEGRAHCEHCSATWTASTADCDAYDNDQIFAAQEYDRMERRERLLRPFRVIAWHLWGRWHQAPVDDEIPF